MILFVSQQVFADARARGGDNDASARYKILIRQISQERDAALAAKSKLEADNKKLQAEVEKNKTKLASASARLKKNADRGQLLSERLQESIDLINELRKQKVKLTAELQQMTDEKHKVSGDYQHCMTMNVKLFDAGKEVVDLFEKKALDKTGFVFKLNEVEIENTVQNYRFLLEDYTLKNSGKSAANSTSP